VSVDAEERRRFAEELLARAEEEARRKGKSEAEIAAAHRKVEEFLGDPSAPLTLPPLEQGRRARVDRLPGLGPGWLMWGLRHPHGWRVALVLLVGVLGYFGLDSGRTSPQPFPDGPPGFLYGSALGVLVVVAVEVASRFRGRRR